MRIVDLFSGAGGLTFGFYYNLINGQFVRNRNEFVFANEFDKPAANAFRANFPDINLIEGDIRDISNEKIKELIGAEAVDIIIGGPPCQSFSTVGKRIYDDKAKMYEEYLRLLKIIKPKMFLFENVKGILSMKEIFYKTDEQGNIMHEEIITKRGDKEIIRKKPMIIGYGKKIMDKIHEQFGQIEDALGYEITPKILNAVDFGVPQNRERVFIVGVRKDIGIKWKFPEEKKPHISIKEAISDLPVVGEGEKKMEYVANPQNNYQTLMRNGNRQLTCHYCGLYGDKIRTVIRNVKQGEGKNDFNKLVEKGVVKSEYKLTSGYANTYGRLVESSPSTTITNSMTTPSGLRCIHYDQNRSLTPREGARIQSFPDNFHFSGNKREDINKQIGNAVPPLLAMALARKIEETIDNER